MHRLAAALLAAALLAAAAPGPGCAEAPALDATAPCRCADGGCTSASCELRLTLDAACAGAVPAAEVLVDGHLEASLVAPGETVTACSRVEPGQSAVVYARGGTWAWGPREVACALPGAAVLTVGLTCDAEDAVAFEAPDAAGDPAGP